MVFVCFDALSVDLLFIKCLNRTSSLSLLASGKLQTKWANICASSFVTIKKHAKVPWYGQPRIETNYEVSSFIIKGDFITVFVYLGLGKKGFLVCECTIHLRLLWLENLNRIKNGLEWTRVNQLTISECTIIEFYRHLKIKLFYLLLFHKKILP